MPELCEFSAQQARLYRACLYQPGLVLGEVVCDVQLRGVADVEDLGIHMHLQLQEVVLH